LNLLPAIGLIQPSVLWLMGLLLVFLPFVYLLRRWWLGGGLSVLVCLLGAYLAWRAIPRGEVLVIQGWIWQYDDLTAFSISLLLVATACLFILSLNTSQGWSFYPLGISILTLFLAAMAVHHLGIEALIIELGVLLSVFIIQGGRIGSTRAASRFLVMMTLAVPFLLLAAWQLEQYQTNQENTPFLSQVALLVGGGFGIWLGVAPLHGWLSGIAAEAKAGIAAFIFITFPCVAIIILLKLLQSASWLLEVPHAVNIIIFAGLFTAMVGGLFASVQRAFGSLMGYSALFDLGIMLIAVGLGTEQAGTMILFALLVRAIALVLIATSSAAFESQSGGDRFLHMKGLARRRPVPAIGLVVGGLTLAGAPFTAGFISRWFLLQGVASMGGQWPLLILLSSLGVAIGYIRGLGALIETPVVMVTVPQKWAMTVMILSLIALCVGLGLFPQSVLTMMMELTG
jgi:formate hydrogenlyase subunit 3/multisubunit Na+/H+ antiporter MnhD subunit